METKLVHYEKKETEVVNKLQNMQSSGQLRSHKQILKKITYQYCQYF